MQERGKDSSGIGVVIGNKYCLCKQAVPASELVETKEYKAVTKWDSQIALAHTRYATVGAITDENAHPFLIGNILGIHNGSVSNYLEVAGHVQVDSEAIFTLLDEHNNDFKEALKQLRGQFAIAWVNMQKPSSLYLVKGANPLYIAKVSQLDTYFFASTYHSLNSIISTFYEANSFTIWQPQEDFVYEIKGNLKIEKTEVSFKPSGFVHTATCICTMCDGYYYAGGQKSKKTNYAEVKEKYSTKQLASGKVTDEEIEEASEIIDNEFIASLTLEQTMEIWEAMSQDVCQLCSAIPDIDGDGAFYYNTIEKEIYCYNCALVFDNEKGFEFIEVDLFYDKFDEFDNKQWLRYESTTKNEKEGKHEQKENAR